MLIRVLGPVEVRTTDGWQRLGAPKWRSLLSRLAISIGSPVSVDALVDDLWPVRPPTGAVNQVHGYVSRLRTLIGDRDRTLLVTRSPGYELMINSDDLDSLRFEDLVDRGEQALRDGDPARASELFAHSLQLWRGPAYADVDAGEEIRTESDRLAERRLRAQEGRIDADLGAGRPAAELITELQTAVAGHPLREHLWAQLMLALYRADRQSDALLAFQDVYRRLDSELGVQPGSALTELQQRILARDPGLLPPAGVGSTAPTTAATAATPSAPPVSPVSPVPSASTGPSADSDHAPRQLPADISDFTGREQELAALDDWLAAADTEPSQGPPALALTGGGGLGKTTLALHWAHRAAGRFPDGQLYVNLRGFATDGELPTEQALSSFLSALGVPPGQIPVAAEESAALLRTRLSDRRALIVLDNAADDHQVLPLLPGAGPSRVLITSRDPLPGLIARGLLRPLRLGELSHSQTEQLLTRIVGRSRVRSEPAATTRLAQLCGGLPLAARITAAQLAGNPDLSVADHLAELEDGSGPRLAALDLDPEHLDDPGASVRAAFDLSFARLEQACQRLFVLLSLAPGDSFSEHAAAALIDADPAGTRRQLARLCSRGMLGPAGPRRYTLHDLLNAYATERRSLTIAPAEQKTAEVRLFSWYVTTAARAVRVAVPPLICTLPDAAPAECTSGAGPRCEVDEAAAAAAWLEAELPQLLALASEAAQDPQRPVWQLAEVLRPYFFHRGNPGDWLVVADAGLTSARAAGHVGAQAAAELGMTQAYRRTSAYQDAAEHADRALRLAVESDWAGGQGAIWNELAILRLEQGDVSTGSEFLQRAIDICRSEGNRNAEAALLINLGHAKRQLGDLAAADRELSQALSVLPATAGPAGIVHASLSAVYRLMGRTDEAAEELDRAEAALGQTLQGRASMLANRCEQKLADEDLDGALADAERAIEMARQLRSVRLESVGLLERAEVRIAAGDAASAIADASAAEKLARQTDASYEWIQSLAISARAQVQAGLTADGRQTAVRAIVESHDHGYRLEEALAETVVAEAEFRLDHHDLAAEHANRALAICRDCGCRQREQDVLRWMPQLVLPA